MATTATIVTTTNERPMIDGGAVLSALLKDDLSNHENPTVQASAQTMMSASIFCWRSKLALEPANKFTGLERIRTLALLTSQRARPFAAGSQCKAHQ